jgi:hypothetical protein
MVKLLAAVLVGCVEPVILDGDGPTVDEACPVAQEDVDATQAQAREALARIACHRALMGLETGPVDADLAASARAHAAYMFENNQLTHTETLGLPNFTGVGAAERAVSAGYPLTPGTKISEVVAWGDTPTDIADAWVSGPYHRQPLSMPGWAAAGYGQVGTWATLVTISPWPASARRAVLYPAHGQAAVPTSWNSDTEWPDPVPEARWTGYPITVTLTAPDLTDNVDDPYDIVVIDATLEGPDGPVETRLLSPKSDDSLKSLVALIPIDILRTSTAYTARFVVEWGGTEEVVQGTFTTGP